MKLDRVDMTDQCWRDGSVCGQMYHVAAAVQRQQRLFSQDVRTPRVCCITPGIATQPHTRAQTS